MGNFWIVAKFEASSNSKTMKGSLALDFDLSDLMKTLSPTFISDKLTGLPCLEEYAAEDV